MKIILFITHNVFITVIVTKFPSARLYNAVCALNLIIVYRSSWSGLFLIPHSWYLAPEYGNTSGNESEMRTPSHPTPTIRILQVEPLFVRLAWAKWQLVGFPGQASLSIIDVLCWQESARSMVYILLDLRVGIYVSTTQILKVM